MTATLPDLALSRRVFCGAVAISGEGEAHKFDV